MAFLCVQMNPAVDTSRLIDRLIVYESTNPPDYSADTSATPCLIRPPSYKLNA